MHFLADGPRCSYKGPQRIYGGIGEKILLLCDMTPFPEDQKPLTFEWKFQGRQGLDDSEKGSASPPEVIRTLTESVSSEDKFQYYVGDRKAFGQIICTARSILQKDVKGTEKPCLFEIVPKGKRSINLIAYAEAVLDLGSLRQL